MNDIATCEAGVERAGVSQSFSGRRATYAMVLLGAVYTCNFIDRSILYILVEPIKRDLGLSDLQVGLLSGTAFAIFYATLGIPIARLAERRNRVMIIACATGLWSLMTAACGQVQNFAQLFLARIGVGVGEAGCTPPAHSILADYFPPERRATAVGLYSLGIPIGQLIGTIGGGWIAAAVSWRAAFVLVGLPGLLLSAIVGITVREPARGRFDPPAGGAHPDLWAVVRVIAADRALIHLTIGVSVATMANAAVNAFTAPFVLRGPFDADLKMTSFWLGIVFGGCALLATGLGGWLSDRLSRRNPDWFLLLPALCFLLCVPLYWIAFQQTSFAAVMLLMGGAQCFLLFYIGPTFAFLHNRVESRMRASAVAIVYMALSLAGYGLGPTLIGSLSDSFASGLVQGFGPDCLASSDKPCAAASFAGLRWALTVDAALYLWAATHYWLAMRCARATRIGLPRIISDPN